MDKGTYAAASAGLLSLRKLEIVNNNLANASTVGFKRQILVSHEQDFNETLASAIGGAPFAKADHDRVSGVTDIRSETDFSPGPIKSTGNPLDVALRNPKDFFVINTPQGPQYTRAGNFTLNAASELSTVDGFQVSGDGGAITLNGPNALITESGAVFVRGNRVGSLQVVRVEDSQSLERVGYTRFKLKDGVPAPVAVPAEVITKSVEEANVSVISSMVDLIAAQRGFEAYTKSAQTIDQLNQTAIGQVGRSRV